MARGSVRRRRGRLQISRQLRRGEFVYLQRGEQITDPEELERIKALVIPPAWHDVQISASPSAKVLARGVDDAGRRQAIYHPSFRRRREEQKFAKLSEFGQALPALRKQVAADMERRGTSREKVAACVIKVLDKGYLRIGTPKYARQYRSYGATTLRRRHTRIKGTSVTFDFNGKSGQHQTVTIEDAQMARFVKKLREMPGYEVFRFNDDEGQLCSVRSEHVNEYLHTNMGSQFTAKDFRTWGGTLTAFASLLDAEVDGASPQRELTRAEREAVKQAASVLGNTQSTARKAYIAPRVLKLAGDPEKLEDLRGERKRRRARKYLSVDEQCLLQLLEEDSA